MRGAARRVLPPHTAYPWLRMPSGSSARVAAVQATTSNAESYKKLTDAHPSVTVHSVFLILSFCGLLCGMFLPVQRRVSSPPTAVAALQWPKLLNAPLAEVDPEVTDIIEKEKNRQWKARVRLSLAEQFFFFQKRSFGLRAVLLLQEVWLPLFQRRAATVWYCG